MVPPASHRISRVPRYSGFTRYIQLRLRGFHPLCPAFPDGSPHLFSLMVSSTPVVFLPPVWPLPFSLATTKRIEFSFFSSGYLDVSLPRVPSCQTIDSSDGDRALPRPGSPIRISLDHCLFAAPHSFSQLITSFIGNQCPGIHPALLFA